VLAYPVLVLVTALVVPGAGKRLWVTVPCGILLLLLGLVRVAAALSFDRSYAVSPGRWRRTFHLGAYASAVVWLVFVLHEMNAGGDAWPTWMMVLMTAGISAGTTTSLCPDAPLLKRFLLLVLGPMILWGLVHGGRDGTAVAIQISVYLAFILVQAQHNSSPSCGRRSPSRRCGKPISAGNPW
jgi:hypothetical protein